MSGARATGTGAAGDGRGATAPSLLWPFALTLERMRYMLNCELDDPVYEALELQWFDDDEHGTGMLAFLQRREGRRVDYYVEPGVHVDRSGYELGGGTGRWVETAFDRASLEVGANGVVARARFTDVDGRAIEVAVDDRAAGPRRAGELLAPVSAGIEAPSSLLLVYLYGFDLVRRRGDIEPVVRIGGRTASPGRLPGAWLHRRHLIKAAGPLTVASLCPDAAPGPTVVDPAAPGAVQVDATGTRLTGMRVATQETSAQVTLEPGLPDLARLPEGSVVTGAWQVGIEGRVITGGRWQVARHGDEVDVRLDVTRRWRPPGGQPPLMRVVTRVIPVFRRWPPTYRWRATVTLGEPPSMTSRWERIGEDRGEAYRRATSR